MKNIRQWLYYILIGVLSFITLVFFPMIGSKANLNIILPNTALGWIIWIGVRLIVSTISVLIFHCFMMQAKLNVREDEKYKEANNILHRCKKREIKPRSPRKWNAEQYGKKATTQFASSMLSTVALTQAVLTYDYMSMLVYIFVIMMSIILGVLQMKKAEIYWTSEYYDYALDQEKEIQEREESEECGNTMEKNIDVFKSK